jgi:hypothetical protein
MWFAVWAVSFMVNNSPATETFTLNAGKDTQQECVQYLTDHRNQLFDYARGFLNLDFDTEIKITEMGCVQENGPV